MKSTVALVLAGLWSVALIVAAAVAPFYQSSSASSVSSSSAANGVAQPQPVVADDTATLLEVNGPGALLPVGIPLLVVAVVAISLRRRQVHGMRGAGPFAWTVSGLLGAFTLVSMLSIGIFVLPVTGLVIVACALAR